MFINFLLPTVCAACNFFGGVGIGVQYADLGVSINWVDRHTMKGKIDEDTIAFALQWEATHYGNFSAGPYVARTVTLDGKGPHPITVFGAGLQWNF